MCEYFFEHFVFELTSYLLTHTIVHYRLDKIQPLILVKSQMKSTTTTTTSFKSKALF
jgi:hypothetical protein